MIIEDFKKYMIKEKECHNQLSSRGAVPAGKLLACVALRPGHCGHADGYMLESKELGFYLRKTKARKDKLILLPLILAH